MASSDAAVSRIAFRSVSGSCGCMCPRKVRSERPERGTWVGLCDRLDLVNMQKVGTRNSTTDTERDVAVAANCCCEPLPTRARCWATSHETTDVCVTCSETTRRNEPAARSRREDRPQRTEVSSLLRCCPRRPACAPNSSWRQCSCPSAASPSAGCQRTPPLGGCRRHQCCWCHRRHLSEVAFQLCCTIAFDNALQR